MSRFNLMILQRALSSSSSRTGFSKLAEGKLCFVKQNRLLTIRMMRFCGVFIYLFFIWLTRKIKVNFWAGQQHYKRKDLDVSVNKWNLIISDNKTWLPIFLGQLVSVPVSPILQVQSNLVASKKWSVD